MRKGLWPGERVRLESLTGRCVRHSGGHTTSCGSPSLKPKRPWYGYDMGEWNEDLETMALRAVQGDYWQTGEIIAQKRRGDLKMNTEVRTLGEGTPGAGDQSKEKGGLTWDGLTDASHSLQVEPKE